MTKASPFSSRDTRGRFAKGNAGGPGNPHARKIAQLRSTLLDSVTKKDLQAVVKALIERAKAGDVAATRELLDRCFGKSKQALDVEMEVEAGAKGEKPIDDETLLEMADTIAAGGIKVPMIIKLKCQRICERLGRKVPERYQTVAGGFKPRALPEKAHADLA